MFPRGKKRRCATLAQLAERFIRNEQVAGSTPAGGSNEARSSSRVSGLFSFPRPALSAGASQRIRGCCSRGRFRRSTRRGCGRFHRLGRGGQGRRGALGGLDWSFRLAAPRGESGHSFRGGIPPGSSLPLPGPSRRGRLFLGRVPGGSDREPEDHRANRLRAHPRGIEETEIRAPGSTLCIEC